MRVTKEIDTPSGVPEPTIKNNKANYGNIPNHLGLKKEIGHNDYEIYTFELNGGEVLKFHKKTRESNKKLKIVLETAVKIWAEDPENVKCLGEERPVGEDVVCGGCGKKLKIKHLSDPETVSYIPGDDEFRCMLCPHKCEEMLKPLDVY